MYIVKNSSGNVEMLCSRKEDALALVGASDIDKESYFIEEMSTAEMDAEIIRRAEEYEDGIGEGMVR